jgi:mono/diheme cytochrome c family protein
MNWPSRLYTAVSAIVLAVGFSLRLMATQESKSEPIYTAQQAERGRTGYSMHCAECHAGDLGGNSEAPKLAGVDFVGSWRERTTRELFQYVEGMPPDGPRLTADEYADIVAFILQRNGAVAGAQALTATTSRPIGEVATGQRPR